MAKTPKIKFELIGLIDRSGSMQNCQDTAQKGFNDFIDEQKALGEPCKVTLHHFDTQFETVWERQPLADVGKYHLNPRGGTALLDAIGQTIEGVKDKGDRNVIVVIVTDGLENRSSKYDLAKISEMVDEKQKAGWLFVFIGAGIDAFSEAGGMGVQHTSTMAVADSDIGYTTAYAGASGIVTRSRLAGTTKGAAFTVQEQEAAQATITGEAKNPPVAKKPEDSSPSATSK